jgi:type VI secretion system secreted protein VgrG
MSQWTLQSRTIQLTGREFPEIVGYTDRRVKISEPMLTVRSVQGREAIGESFRYTVVAQMENPDFLANPADAAQVDLTAILHSSATIEIQGEGIGTFVPGMKGSNGRANIGADSCVALPCCQSPQKQSISAPSSSAPSQASGIQRA